MRALILDRFGRIAGPAPFLAAAGPYDRSLGRTALFVAAALAATLAVALTLALALAALPNADRAGRSLISYGYELSVAGLGSFAAAAAALALAARIYRRPVRSFLTAAPRFRWRAVAAGLAVGLPLVGVAFAVEQLIAPSPLAAPIATPGAGLAERLAYAGVALVTLYGAAFAEEALFRGWLLQQTAAWTRSAPVILAVNGVAFSLAHLDPDPAGFLVRAVMGAGWAWIALRTAGVEFTTGAHLANNLFVALIVTPVRFTAPAAHGPTDLRPALIELAIVLAMATVVELWLRRRGEGEAAAPS